MMTACQASLQIHPGISDLASVHSSHSRTRSMCAEGMRGPNHLCANAGQLPAATFRISDKSFQHIIVRTTFNR